MIRINLLTEAKAAAARKKGPFLPAGAKLNNLLFFGAFGLGVAYVVIMGLTLLSRRSRVRRHSDPVRYYACARACRFFDIRTAPLAD